MLTMHRRNDLVTAPLPRDAARALGVAPGTPRLVRVCEIQLDPNRKPGLGRVSYLVAVQHAGHTVGTFVVPHAKLT